MIADSGIVDVLSAFDIKHRQQLVLNVDIPSDAFTVVGFLGQAPPRGSLTSRSIESQRPPRIVGQAARIKGAASIDGEVLNVPSPPKEIVRSEFLGQETSITPGFPINDPPRKYGN